MDNETIGITEIATALGISRVAVFKKANKNNWPYKVVNRRGERLFNIADLPVNIQDELWLAEKTGEIERQKESRPAILIIAIRFKLWKLDIEWALKL